MKIINIFGVLLFLLTISGCKKLDIEPQNSVTFNNYFKTENDLYRALLGVQSNIRLEGLNSVTIPVAKGELADEINPFSGRYSYRNLDPAYFKGITQYTSWNNWYTIIAGANLIIDNIDKPQGLTDQQRNLYLGQAIVYRAFAYFNVIQQWGDAPLVENSLDIGRKGVTPWPYIADRLIAPFESSTDFAKISRS